MVASMTNHCVSFPNKSDTDEDYVNITGVQDGSVYVYTFKIIFYEHTYALSTATKTTYSRHTLAKLKGGFVLFCDVLSLSQMTNFRQKFHIS